jgi:arylsulfatase A-like enzyme
VGRLLDYLETSGLAENTIVVYTSDNGYFLGEHALYNKQWMYRPSHTIPLLIRYPETITPGTQTDRLVGTIDFGPTFLEMAGVSVPEEMQGVSFCDLLKDQQSVIERPPLYYHYYGQYDVPEHTGLRTNSHSLMHFLSGAASEQEQTAFECYDLKNDPEETHNLCLDPNAKDVIQPLKTLYQHEKKRLNDTSSATGRNADVTVKTM